MDRRLRDNIVKILNPVKKVLKKHAGVMRLAKLNVITVSTLKFVLCLCINCHWH